MLLPKVSPFTSKLNPTASNLLQNIAPASLPSFFCIIKSFFFSLWDHSHDCTNMDLFSLHKKGKKKKLWFCFTFYLLPISLFLFAAKFNSLSFFLIFDLPLFSLLNPLFQTCFHYHDTKVSLVKVKNFLHIAKFNSGFDVHIVGEWYFYPYSSLSSFGWINSKIGTRQINRRKRNTP